MAVPPAPFWICAHKKTGIPYQDIPLDDEAVFSALRKADPEESVASACKLVGSGICTLNTEIFCAMNVQNLRSLSRFMSLSHSSGAWQENQQLLLENGTLTPDMLITCREDIYRYMMEHGASTTEATAMMDSVRMGLPSRFGYSASDELALALCQVDPLVHTSMSGNRLSLSRSPFPFLCNSADSVGMVCDPSARGQPSPYR